MRHSSSLKRFAKTLSAKDAARIARSSNPAELINLVGTLRNTGIATEILAQARGCESYEIRHLLRMHRNLSTKTKTLLQDNRITLTQARVLASMSHEKQDQHALACATNQLSVRDLKARVARDEGSTQSTMQPNKWADYYSSIGEVVGSQTGYPCTFNLDAGSERAGYLQLRFTSFDELEGILNRLRIKRDDAD